MGRNLIVGDIHSQFSKLMAVLDKASFNPDVDMLYSVGDFCDRGSEAVRTLQFLMGLRNFKAVIGNHDILLQKWLYTDIPDWFWEDGLGGDKTIEDFETNFCLDRKECLQIANWLKSLPLVLVEEKYIIAHGGIPYSRTMADLIKYQNQIRRAVDNMFTDDAPACTRDYFFSAYGDHPMKNTEIPFSFVEPFETDKTIFIGHTPTVDGKPFFSEEYHLVALDTGAGSGGPLTLMDMDTLEYWQA